MRFLVFFLVALPAFAGTYYVDFDAGSDANDGTTQLTAWRTIPGTYNAAGTGYVASQWGAFDTVSRIPDNTNIKIKCGTTHTSADGGYVWLSAGSGAFYNLAYTNIVIEADQTWGTGTIATIDGSGMTIGIALILNQIDGVTLRNLAINNSSVNGIQFKEKAGSGKPLTNCFFFSLICSNNGTGFSTDAAGAGSGNINVRHGQNVVVSNCLISGNQQFINGILFGDTGKRVGNGVVVGCTVTNVKGDFAGNDAGIGIKCFNSEVLVLSNYVSGNLKGCDLGEQTGATANADGTPATINYKAIGNTVISNQWGINFNGPAANYSASIKQYAINNLIMSNGVAGMNIYSGPHQAHVVHNVFVGNGWNSTWASPKFNNAQIITTANASADTNHIEFHCYNNVFLLQLVGSGNTNTGVFLNKRMYAANDYTLDSDYNYYEQNSTNGLFSIIGASGALTALFNFGTNGPGNASGNWYDWYANSTTPLTHAGTGHYHSDAHSRGTGAVDSSLPPLSSNFIMTNTYPGLNLSTKSWYISEMGVDRLGVTRNFWDLGAYESTGFGGVPTVINYPRNLRFRNIRLR